MHLGEADVAARGELGELGSALELPLGGVRVRVRVRVKVRVKGMVTRGDGDDAELRHVLVV
jgi:hypothetical protein